MFFSVMAFDRYLMPNEVSLIAANLLGIVRYGIGAAGVLALLGLAKPSSWSFGTMFSWTEVKVSSHWKRGGCSYLPAPLLGSSARAWCFRLSLSRRAW
jgi:hypothetical protein